MPLRDHRRKASKIKDMSKADRISVWIEGLRNADDDSARRVWDHFGNRLLELAKGRLNSKTRRLYDEEDAVQSMFESVCFWFASGRFPDLKDRESLWRLMLVITGQKISNRHRFDLQQRRDVRRTVTDSVFNQHGQSGESAADMPDSREPSPEFAAEFVETCQCLFSRLADPLLEKVATLRMEGYTDTEVADRMGCSRRTVQRRLEIIRRHLSNMELMNEPRESSCKSE